MITGNANWNDFLVMEKKKKRREINHQSLNNELKSIWWEGVKLWAALTDEVGNDFQVFAM